MFNFNSNIELLYNYFFGVFGFMIKSIFVCLNKLSYMLFFIFLNGFDNNKEVNCFLKIKKNILVILRVLLVFLGYKFFIIVFIFFVVSSLVYL